MATAMGLAGLAICNSALSIVAHILVEEGVADSSLLGSYMLADALSGDGVPFTIKTGIVSLGARTFKQVYHIWLEYEGNVLDVGKKVEELRSGKKVPCVYKARGRYSLTADDEKLKALAHDSREEYWATASEEVIDVRDTVRKALHDRRETILKRLIAAKHAKDDANKHAADCDCSSHKH